MNRMEAIALTLIIAAFLAGAYVYPMLPETVATHWDEHGNPNGWSSREFAVFFFPAMMLALLALLAYLPHFDPLRKNVEKFSGTWNLFKVIFIAFMLYIYLLSLAANLGMGINIGYAMMPAFALLFWFMGVLVEKAKTNWFIGIRTPWTLSSKQVWDRTHKLGAKHYKACALIVLLGLAFPEFTIWFVIVPIILTSIFLFVYSYLEYRKLEKKGRG